MSDEHKRQAEYHARAIDQGGLTPRSEVTTAGRTRVDVVAYGGPTGPVGFEIQRSALTRAAALDRTARSVAGGLAAVAWFTDRDARPVWTGHVPGYRSVVRGLWASLPLPGTVTAAGVQDIGWERTWRGWELVLRPHPMLVDDLVTGLAEGTVRPYLHGRYVRLMPATSAAACGIEPWAPGVPRGRPHASAPVECNRPPAIVSDSSDPNAYRNGGTGGIHGVDPQTPFWCEVCGGRHPIIEHRDCARRMALADGGPQGCP